MTVRSVATPLTSLQQEATALYNLGSSLVQIVADVKLLRTHPAIIDFFGSFGLDAKGQVSGDQLERFRRLSIDELAQVMGQGEAESATLSSYALQHVADVIGLGLCVQKLVAHGNIYTNTMRRAFFEATKADHPELPTARQLVEHFNGEVAKAERFGQRMNIAPTPITLAAGRNR